MWASSDTLWARPAGSMRLEQISSRGKWTSEHALQRSKEATYRAGFPLKQRMRRTVDPVSAEAFTIPVVTRSSSIKPLFKPLPEQQRAFSLFQRQEGLRIDAYAGTGKTTTLQYLSANTRQHGLYLAFNRSIAIEARSRFTSRVSCTTTHSIAFRGVKKAYRYPEWKLTEPISAIRIAEAFHLPEMVSFNSGLLLPRGSYASALLGGLRRFLQSDDEAPRTFHMMRQGALANLTDASSFNLPSRRSSTCALSGTQCGTSKAVCH